MKNSKITSLVALILSVLMSLALFAACGEEGTKDIADVRADAVAALDAELEKYSEADYTSENWTALTGIVSAAKTEIEAAETEQKVNEIKDKAISDMKGVVKKPVFSLTEAQAAAKAEIDAAVAALNESDYDAEQWEEIGDIVAFAKEDIDAAQTAEEVEEIKTLALEDLNGVPDKEQVDKNTLEAFPFENREGNVMKVALQDRKAVASFDLMNEDNAFYFDAKASNYKNFIWQTTISDLETGRWTQLYFDVLNEKGASYYAGCEPFFNFENNVNKFYFGWAKPLASIAELDREKPFTFTMVRTVLDNTAMFRFKLEQEGKIIFDLIEEKGGVSDENFMPSYHTRYTGFTATDVVLKNLSARENLEEITNIYVVKLNNYVNLEEYTTENKKTVQEILDGAYDRLLACATETEMQAAYKVILAEIDSVEKLASDFMALTSNGNVVENLFGIAGSWDVGNAISSKRDDFNSYRFETLIDEFSYSSGNINDPARLEIRVNNTDGFITLNFRGDNKKTGLYLSGGANAAYSQDEAFATTDDIKLIVEVQSHTQVIRIQLLKKGAEDADFVELMSTLYRNTNLPLSGDIQLQARNLNVSGTLAVADTDVAEKEALVTAYLDIIRPKQSDYTPENWAILSPALAEVETAIESGNYATVNTKLNALEKLISETPCNDESYKTFIVNDSSGTYDAASGSFTAQGSWGGDTISSIRQDYTSLKFTMDVNCDNFDGNPNNAVRIVLNVMGTKLVVVFREGSLPTGIYLEEGADAANLLQCSLSAGTSYRFVVETAADYKLKVTVYTLTGDTPTKVTEGETTYMENAPNKGVGLVVRNLSATGKLLIEDTSNNLNAAGTIFVEG